MLSRFNNHNNGAVVDIDPAGISINFPDDNLLNLANANYSINSENTALHITQHSDLAHTSFDVTQNIASLHIAQHLDFAPTSFHFTIHPGRSITFLLNSDIDTNTTFTMWRGSSIHFGRSNEETGETDIVSSYTNDTLQKLDLNYEEMMVLIGDYTSQP